jgi:hypothetical protein
MGTAGSERASEEGTSEERGGESEESDIEYAGRRQKSRDTRLHTPSIANSYRHPCHGETAADLLSGTAQYQFLPDLINS